MKPEKKIYLAYYNSKKNELYFNEIKDLSGLSDSSLARSLNKLVKNNTLSKNITKSNTFYKIKNYKLFALKYSEIALLKFNNLNSGIKIPLEEFLSNMSQTYTIILFGSSSIKKETKKSDIDLLIVSSKNNKKISIAKKKAELISNYPINIFTCNQNQFIKSQDTIIKQAKNTGFPIKGEQNFYEVILNEN